MPGNPPVAGGSGNGVAVTATDTLGSSRGRKRYCKKCKFTCTDAREFTAHQTAHAESHDNKTAQAASSSHASSTSNDNFQSGRVLRPKRNSKGSISEQDTSSLTMELATDSLVESLSGKAIKTTDLITHNADLITHKADLITHNTDLISYNANITPLLIDGDETENRAAKSEQKYNFDYKSEDFKREDDEEPMYNDEGEDEPDAMTTSSQNDVKDVGEYHSDVNRLSSDITENFSADEDVDEEVRLVIDDESLTKHPSRLHAGQFRTYSCQHCEMTTTSAKAYLHHLNKNHNTEVNIYECHLCDYATVYKQKLTKHRRIHYLTKGEEPCSPSIDPADKIILDKVEEKNHFSQFSFSNSSKYNSPFMSEKTEDLEDDGDDDISCVDHKPTSISVTITPENIDQVLDEDKKKKKKTRQEVDPGKYFEAVDSSGTKYACSQCGNIYKWRKSLNKHWKEKHSMDPLVEVASPPGMLELLKSGKYTQLGARRIYDKSFLATIKTNKNDDPSLIKSSPHSLIQTPSPPNFLNSTPIMVSSAARLTSSVTSLMPKIIGPFVASNTQPVFPGMPMAMQHLPLHNNGYDSPEEGALDLTRDNKPRSKSAHFVEMSRLKSTTSFDQEQPLDFSKTKNATENVKSERLWDDMSSMKPAHSINQLIPRLHHCSKCDFSSASEVEFANHTSSHLNKRIVRCYECKLQINSMDELNNHFIKHHFRKLTDYKEAIKKIPHGLQQTYHLLNMEIHDIGELGNQDLGASEGKSLKCKKCDFEAKWPAELQKHAVSHSEERPYICMVCGSTYKWKWDLVKHFQKSHPNLPNPYRRNDKKDSPDGSSEDEDEPVAKRPKFEMNSGIMNGNLFNRDDNISVEGIIAATQAGQRLISSQPNILDDEPVMDRNLSFLKEFPYSAGSEMNQVSQIVQAAQAAQEIDRRNKAQKAMQDVRNRQNSSGSSDSSNHKKNGSRDTASLSPSPGGSKSEDLPYKCTMCNYHARWPSEVTQHMKNHSDSKPYLCPRCEYRSKWKWDVVKHLKRCGGGGINDVIDTTKSKRKDFSVSNGPPNAIVSQQGKVKKTTPQPPLTYILSSVNENGQQSTMMVRSGPNNASDASSSDDLSRSESNASNQDMSNSSANNNDSSAPENNVNNNYSSYTSGLPFDSVNQFLPATTNVLSTMGSINSSNSPAHSPAPSPVTHASSARHNAEVWNCPHCPFTTQSQAELKRHSGLHSDDKPFKCDVCQYSTRWACDLKKHRKSYNHFPRTTTIKDNKEKVQASQGRFKCTQCAIFFQTLQNLLDHRMAEHIGQDSSQSSPAPVTEIEIDAARIKHPRKQVKKIECSKCPFVCKNRQTMEKHMDEHEQLEMSGIHCFYCSSLFKDKESLLDHITTHSAFNPKEWETFFMISDEDQHQLKDDRNVIVRKDLKHQQISTDKIEVSGAQVNKKYTENEKLATESTEARIQQILSEVPKQLPVSQQSPSISKFKCEWCPAEFMSLTAVYKHASQAHPIQLKEQDVGMVITGQSHLAKLSSGHKSSSKKPYPGEPIDILKQQIAEKRNHQLTDKYDDMVASNSKIQETMGNKSEDEKASKWYNCDKCSFSSANFATFQRHLELHGSKLTSQCWFCDYSVDRMNLLYQHMKISHTRKWKAMSQDPKYAAQIHRMNLAFANSGIHGNNNDSPPENSQTTDFNAMDLSSKNKTSHPEVTHDIMYVTKQQYTWSGIPVNIVPVGNALNFVCPHCAFHDASIAETCCHVMQSHRAMSKFTCKTCQFCDDNIHVMSDHCKTEHPIQDRTVEVLDFKQINFSELQIVQLNALREQMAHDLNRKSSDAAETKTLATKAMSCPFCPFKTLISEHMKKHVSDHSKHARYRCQVCDFSSDATADINDHAKVHESGYMLDYRSIQENKLPVYVKKEIKDRKINEEDSKMAARVASILEPSDLCQSDQEDSPRSKSGKRIRYRCSTCPYHTTCRSNMVKHARQHNNNKKYKCSKCSYGAARAVLLRNHLDSHKTPVEDDGQYYDIFCDPNSSNNTFKGDTIDDFESEETEMDVEEFDEDNDDDEANSDESDEIDVKAIVNLEAKDILEAEAAHTASTQIEDGDNIDKQFRKQKCLHCPFSSNSVYEFRKHLNFHGTQERYKCDRCSYSLDRLNLLTQHRKLHADEPGYSPNPPAADLLNTGFILQQNTERVDTEEMAGGGGSSEVGDSQFSCFYCPYKASKKKLFDIHCNSHDLRKCYICDFCDWSADRMGLLYQHRRVHENEPTYNPSPEDKVFFNQEYDDGTKGEFEAKFMEIKHISNSEETGETETPLSPPFKLTVVKKSYPCKLCPYKTNSKNSYFFHKSMHDSGADFACSECSYAAVNNGLLQQHLRLHNTESTNVCSPTSSTVRNQLNKQKSLDKEISVQQDSSSLFSIKIESPDAVHQLENTSGSELKCQRCPFTASSQSGFKEHMKCHAAQENLTCPFCDFSVASRQMMFPHIQIHFPGTKLEPEALERILEQHTKVTNNNVLNSHDDISKSLSPKAERVSAPSEKETSSMKRLYVCHFCEREFEDKHLIVQHVKQHLLGGHSEEKCN